MQKENNLNSIFNEITFHTSLLESLGWDESQLEALFLYLNNSLENDLKYETIVQEIKDNYGEDCLKIIVDIFNNEAFLLKFRSRQ